MRKQVSPMGIAAVILGLQSALLVVILLAFSLSVRAHNSQRSLSSRGSFARQTGRLLKSPVCHMAASIRICIRSSKRRELVD